MGVAFQKIEDVFYTHHHLDHMLDLLTLLFAKRNPETTNPPLLNIYGGPGMTDLVGKLRALFHPWLEPTDYRLHVEEYTQPIDLGAIHVSACRTGHHTSSLAYRFDGKNGSSLVVSGDTGEDEDLVALSRGASLLVLECSFPDDKEVEGHLTPSLAGALAKRAGVKRLLLTHFYPSCDGREILGPCHRTFQGEVMLAHEGMRVSVG
jgi:ribonuclease BN (tRNA processing enzyme)